MTGRLVIRERELEAVFQIPAPARYSYFVKRVTDWQQAWGLHLDGWVLLGSAEGAEFFPLWPAKEFAEACATPLGFEGATAEVIDLNRLMRDLIPGLRESGRSLAVFPNRKGAAATVDPGQVLTSIETELENY